MTTELSAPTTGRGMRNRPFRTVRVAEVQQLCADAAAITFAVPDQYIDEFGFALGNPSQCAGTSTESSSAAPIRSARRSGPDPASGSARCPGSVLRVAGAPAVGRR